MADAVEVLRKRAGVGSLTIKRLENSGLLNLNLLSVMNPEEVMEIAKIKDYTVARRIVEAARAETGLALEVVSAADVEGLESELPRLTTGLESFDEMLGGGLRVRDLYEFAGEFGSGKTQLCHQLSVTVQLPPERGGLGRSALYIDTEGTFSSARIRLVGQRFGVDATGRVFLVRPVTVDQLEDFVRRRLAGLVEDRDIGLVVIDSVIALYRAQFKGLENLARRQQALNYILDWVKRIARRYDLVAVITNQVLSQPLPSGIVYKLPAGGNIIAHASTHRFFLRKSGEKWILEVLDSPRLPRKAAVQFVIREDGLHDV